MYLNVQKRHSALQQLFVLGSSLSVISALGHVLHVSALVESTVIENDDDVNKFWK
jgi:hypothetical protein